MKHPVRNIVNVGIWFVFFAIVVFAMRVDTGEYYSEGISMKFEMVIFSRIGGSEI